jgi:hypothetical protein
VPVFGGFAGRPHEGRLPDPGLTLDQYRIAMPSSRLRHIVNQL